MLTQPNICKGVSTGAGFDLGHMFYTSAVMPSSHKRSGLLVKRLSYTKAGFMMSFGFAKIANNI
jgi:hypothetical protein